MSIISRSVVQRRKLEDMKACEEFKEGLLFGGGGGGGGGGGDDDDVAAARCPRPGQRCSPTNPTQPGTGRCVRVAQEQAPEEVVIAGAALAQSSPILFQTR